MSIGSTLDAAWDGEDANATVIALLKAIHDQLVLIETNTGT